MTFEALGLTVRVSKRVSRAVNSGSAVKGVARRLNALTV
jgi:hypothetical protein